ncbi:hypothetical protein [Azospirillum sp. SYSU D00513]|uniref:hypothetical protein n=1 Tax=Azospirillum sp. SYSU D00513 TaxID=2812561 RepID=UPI001FFEB5D7|nr:hypothetical protein [Azospirillum sp. SYSU D00513]
MTSVAGLVPQGADRLREQLRWAAAERRWQEPASKGHVFPVPPPIGQGALRRGAQLTRFTHAHGTAGGAASGGGAF